LALPKPVQHWSLTTLWEKLVKIGAKMTRHSKDVTIQRAEVSVTRNVFAAILNGIALGDGRRQLSSAGFRRRSVAVAEKAGPRGKVRSLPGKAPCGGMVPAMEAKEPRRPGKKWTKSTGR
jgi:hypothetical protein